MLLPLLIHKIVMSNTPVNGGDAVPHFKVTGSMTTDSGQLRVNRILSFQNNLILYEWKGLNVAVYQS